TGVPVDFVSSHVYGDETSQNVFHDNRPVSRADMVCKAVDKVHREILASPYPKLPLVFSEYNASYANLPNVTDTVFMGPWMANTIRECAGKISMMSYWTFSDVFEEQGVVRTPFYGGFGLIAEDRIDKPAFNAFAMLHKLGDVRLPLKSDSALATRRADGTLVLALWNYAPPVGDGATYTPGEPKGAVKHFDVDVSHLAKSTTATVWRLDEHHGNAVGLFDKMGRPAFPSREQIEQLRAAGNMAAPQQLAMHDGRLSLDIPPQGLAVGAPTLGNDRIEWQGRAAVMQSGAEGTYALRGTFGERAIPAQPRAVQTASVLFDGLFAMAQDDLKLDSVSAIRDGAFDHGQPIPCHCFETGEKWPYVWTRDLSYSVDLGLWRFDPARSRNGLLFKLSGVRAKDVPQGLYPMQDTGSGGSWPISTDRVVWFLGARHLLGDKAFADKMWPALNDTLAQDREYAFDAQMGLYRGETSFLDWREQTYPEWTKDNVVFIGQSFTLSTNVLHYEAL